MKRATGGIGILLLGLLCGVSCLAPAAAQSLNGSGDAFEGRALARNWCGGCHAVDARPIGPLSDAAPAFAAVAAMPSTTALSISVFLRSPHAPMPDFALTERQISDIAAYILALRTSRP